MAKETFTEDQKTEIALMIEDAVNKAIAGVPGKINVTPNPDYKLPKDVSPLDVVTVEATKGNPFHKGKYKCEAHQAQLHIQKGLAVEKSLEVIEEYKPKEPGRVLGKVEKV